MEFIMRVMALILVMFSASCVASTDHYSLTTKPLGPYLEVPAGGFIQLKLPLTALDQAKLIGGDAMTFILSDRTGFTLSTFTDKKVGYPGVDMRSWPLYALGLKEQGEEPAAYISELKGVRSMILAADNEIYRVAELPLENVTVYLALGRKRSTIYVISHEINDRIVVISIDGMSEKAIQDVFLQGAVQ